MLLQQMVKMTMVVPNQCCETIEKEMQGWFLGDIFGLTSMILNTVRLFQQINMKKYGTSG